MKRPVTSLRSRQAQRGISLIVVLILLLAVGILGASAAVIALQTEKATRGDQDRQIAFQAAEAALIDAQMDIDYAPNAGGTHARAGAFSARAIYMFPQAGCNSASGADAAGFGLCAQEGPGIKPAWLTANFDDTGANATSVPYGYFTGQHFAQRTAAAPRYVIEAISLAQEGADQSLVRHFFRITAIGYGAQAGTQVVLQAFYLKQE